jgi:hypothetical protein
MEEIVRHMHEWVTKQERKSIIPDTLIIPGAVRQWLYEQGYETEEQVVELVKDICTKDA